jgi:amino acid adenylation domain-containing protein
MQSSRIDERFVEQVRSNPDRVAIEEGRASWLYGELDELVEHLANQLRVRLQDSAPDHPVFILGKRSAGLVLAILAVVRAGRTFAVTDATYPPHRVHRQFEVLIPALVIGVELSAETIGSLLPDATDVPILPLTMLGGPPVLADDRLPDAPPSQTAYMLFTSGTTGTPKAIRTGHAPLLHFLQFYEDIFEPGPADRFSLLSGLGHDPMLRDIFVPLSVGATLCVPDESIVRSPLDLYEWLLVQRISFFHCTPQLLRLVTSGQGVQAQLTALQRVFCGGDVLLAAHVQALTNIAPSAKLVNFYGSSETPQAMAFHEVLLEDAAVGPIPLGRGIDDVQMLILRSDLTVAAVGEIGEIGIRTHFLSDGYLYDDAETQDRYIESPFVPDDGARIYRTGDLGRYRSDGVVIGAGRIDDQVKIRGYRVELGDVVAAIDRSGLVVNATVIAPEVKTGEKMLVAFVVTATGKEDPSLRNHLRAFLTAELPSYMVPAKVLQVDSLPLTSNAKVDRSALEAILRALTDAQRDSLRDNLDLDDRLRALIAEIEDVLKTTIDRLDYSFVDLGGDSLSYIRVSMVVEDLYGRLPDQWEEQPLSIFAEIDAADDKNAQTVRPSLGWVQLELSILLRCVSILLVVVNHAGAGLFMAATSVLFVVSGINFNRFIVPAMRRSGSLWPAWHFVFRFAFPAGLWQLLRAFWLHAFWLPNLLLMGTFVQNPVKPVYTFWYLDVLAANVLTLGLLLRWVESRRSHAAPSNAFATSLMLLAGAYLIAIGQSATGWWDGELGRDSVAPFKWLWLLILGVAISQANSSVRKWWLSGISGAICASAMASESWIPGLSGLVNGFLLLAAWALIWYPTVRVPRWMKRVVVVIASSTLFIYIVNYSVIYHLMPRLGLPAALPVQVASAVLVGIVATRIWERISSGVVYFWRRQSRAKV